mgnify:CR=1 FL=1
MSIYNFEVALEDGYSLFIGKICRQTNNHRQILQQNAA